MLLLFLLFPAAFPPHFWSEETNPHELLRKEKENLSKALYQRDTCRKQLESLVQEKSVLTDRLTAMTTEVSGLQSNLDQATARRDYLSKEEEKCLAKNRKLQSEVDGLLADYTTLEGRIALKKKAIESSAQRLKDMDLEVEQNQESVRLLQTLNQTHLSQLSLAQDALKDIRRAIHESSGQLTQLYAGFAAALVAQPNLLSAQTQAMLS